MNIKLNFITIKLHLMIGDFVLLIDFVFTYNTRIMIFFI